MPNRLAEATSPYLLQHKDNPVDWWEWGDEAFQIARDRDVPVLLSVGYAACHWCHVMAHESFEDTDTATVMNERFVNIKVDREERPDVDSIYMEAVQAMSGHGGWPMTVWIDHAGRPFFAGTYFPKEAHHGMASFRQVIDAVSDAWVNRRDDVSEQASRLIGAISSEIPAGDAIDDEMLQSAFTKISSAYDPAHGGFGGAPKFPQQPVLEFLLRVHEQPWASRAGAMLTKTLEKMAAGGIHDQLGGGFARYSVDPHWLVPHFEKMLYDNAQLARLYLWAGVEFGRDDFSEVARKTLDYMTTDLRHREGGFFSSEDADSEGVEGKFYVWTPQEVKEILGDRAVDFMAAYDVTETGNFEGSNILRVVGEVDGFDEERERLFEARSARIRPGLDDKVVAAWNGLAIRAFAEAGATLDEPRYVEFARSAANFALEHLMIDGRMMRSWRDGRTSVPGFLDDHAATALGLFALYAATGEETWYSHAIDLVHQFERFGKQGGGFFTTADDSEALVKRPTDIADNPLPSGPGLAAEALLWASLYTGDHDWRDRSAETLAAVGTIASNYPSMVGHHLSVAAVETKELAIVGAGWRDLAAVYWSRYRPGVVLAGSESGSASLPLLAGRQSENGPLAFVCKDFVCDLPTSDSTKLAALLA